MNARDQLCTRLTAFFAVILVLGNLVGQKIVELPLLPFYTFRISVGVITYPLTFLITDLITEFHGKERATFCVRTGVILNILVAGILWGLDALPAAPWSKVSDSVFHQMFAFYGTAFVGSMIACTVSQRVDIALYLGIRRLTKGRFLWMRNTGSTAVSLLLDTVVIHTVLAAAGFFPWQEMGALVTNSYSFKLLFTVCSSPLFCATVALIQRFIPETGTPSKS
jgi:uncharacterized integral membrane protein (TIGR00697 family)